MSSNKELEGKVAIVTGAASGIGLGITQLLAERDARGCSGGHQSLSAGTGVREDRTPGRGCQQGGERNIRR